MISPYIPLRSALWLGQFCHGWVRRSLFCAVVALSWIFFLYNIGLAATIQVNTTEDVVADDTLCSLREAIINANQDDQSGSTDCPAGNDKDIITLPAGFYELSILGSSENSAATGDLDIRRPLTITGAGPEQTIISGRNFLESNTDRLFHFHNANTDVTLQGMTLESTGLDSDTGSLIHNNAGGTVILQNMVFRDTISIGTDGGPIVHRGFGSSGSNRLRILNSAILSTYGSNTGAIRQLCNNPTTLELSNVTIASTSHGSFSNNTNGTIRVDGGCRATLTNVTLFNNRYGLEIEEGAILTATNLLLVNNGDDNTGRNCRTTGSGQLVSLGGNYSSDSTCANFVTATDVNGGGDPGISDLSFISGTVVIPLFDDHRLPAATTGCPTDDQTGNTRSAPSGCMPGAYESVVSRPTSTSNSAQTANTISGLVFRDYNSDGKRDTQEPAISNVTVTSYHITGSDSTTTDQDGRYQLSVPDNLAIRIEFTGWPAYLQPSRYGSDSNTPVQFVNSPNNQVNLALSNPGQYCQSNPDLATSCYVFGEQNGNREAVLTFPYSAGSGSRSDGSVIGEAGFGPQGNPDPPWAYDLPAHPILAVDTEVGSTWGMAYQRSTERLFVSAFMKRHAGFGPDGPGAIYQVDVNTGIGSANLLIDLGSAGADPHTDYEIDTQAWDAVGKVGLGDLDISEDDQTLYVINLADRHLYSIPIISPTLFISTAIPLHLPGATQGCHADDVRPFSLGVNDGNVYVGLLCSAEATQSADDLRLYLYTFTPVIGGAGTFGTTPILEFGLAYPHGYALAGRYQLSGNWRPWTPGNTVPIDLIHTEGATRRAAYPQPMLADIVFDRGDILLSFMDRLGHQQSSDGDLPDGDPDTNADNVHHLEPAGDLLRACADGAGGWVLEQNGACGGRITAGSNNGQGPANGEYYFQEELLSGHPENVAGGMAQVAGQPDVAYIVYDPVLWSRDFNSAGVHWADNDYGTWQKGYRLYDTRPGQDTFGKSNGLGDLEALCHAAPIEIGNRVWHDLDGDGIQGPEEPPIAGVLVHLYAPDQSILATAQTDANGTYFFSSASGINTTHAIYHLSGLMANAKGYTVRLDNDADYTTGGPLHNFELTTAKADGSTNGERRDSDGLMSNGFPQIIVNTGLAGHNNFSYDFGFRTKIVQVGVANIQQTPSTSTPTNTPTMTTMALPTLTSAPSVTPTQSATPTPTQTPTGTPTTQSTAQPAAQPAEPQIVLFTPIATSTLPPTTTPTPTATPSSTSTLTPEPAIIIIRKETDRPSNIPFQFEIDRPLAPSLFWLFSGEEKSFIVEQMGLYTIRENQRDGWILNRIDCDDPDGESTTHREDASAIVEIDPGETVRCTFTNVYPTATETTTLTSTPTPMATATSRPTSKPMKSPTPTLTIQPMSIQPVTTQPVTIQPTNMPTFIPTFTPTLIPTVTPVAIPSEEPLSSIGEIIWFDLDQDGVQEDGEDGISGIQVMLYTLDGTLVAESWTDEEGHYLFTNLAPGDYTVVITLPPEFSISTSPTNGAVVTGSTIENGVDEAQLVLSVTTVPGEDISWSIGLYQAPAAIGEELVEPDRFVDIFLPIVGR